LSQLLQALEREKPETLYLVSDGPRYPEDIPLIAECRAIAEKISWPCSVTRIYSETNLGMGPRSLSAIDQAMSNHEGLLILEDDCIPREGLLQYLRVANENFVEDDSVASYGGYNPIGRTPLLGNEIYSASTSFRGWGQYLKKKHWEEYKANGILPYLNGWTCLREALKYPGFFNKCIKFKILFAHRKDIGHGDISISTFFLRNNYLCLVPRENLIDYIGVGDDATHTAEVPSLMLRQRYDIDFNRNNGLRSGIRPIKRVDVIYGWLTAVWLAKKIVCKLFGMRR